MKLTVITNLPAPYRVHQFGALHQELATRGGSLDVRFMAKQVRYRNWQIDFEAMTFPHSFSRGFHPGLRYTYFRINPFLAAQTLMSRPTWIMVGGSWWIPTALSVELGAKLFSRDIPLIFWAEANSKASKHNSGLIGAARRLLLSRYDAFAVPGSMATTTLETWGIPEKLPRLSLPNVVDETIFNNRVETLRARREELRRRWDLASSNLVVVWPARLHEATKGHRKVLLEIAEMLPDHVRIMLAGDGPDQRALTNWIDQTAPGKIRVLGWCTQDQMTELYALADAFMLPSLADPNPLSVVEALWSGLPLLISDRCGNWIEAVEPYSNGWVVNPESGRSIKEAWSNLVESSPARLTEMGEESRKRARAFFETESSVAGFVDQLLKLEHH